MAGMYNDIKSLIEKRGQPVRFRYFNQSLNAGSYDDDTALTQSGTDLWISGFPQVIRETRGSKDAVLLEQGLVTSDDLKLYVEGITRTDGMFKVGLFNLSAGSPTTDEYAIIEKGTEAPLLNGSVMYRKLYLRKLTTGSIFGEV